MSKLLNRVRQSIAVTVVLGLLMLVAAFGCVVQDDQQAKITVYPWVEGCNDFGPGVTVKVDF